MSNNESFKDEVYENMDDISKLIEPFEYGVNNELSLFPDEIEYTPEYFAKLISYGSWGEYWNESFSSVIRREAAKLGLLVLEKEIINNYNFVNQIFQVVAEPDFEGDNIYFDAATSTIIGGRIFIRKKKIAVEDKDIEGAFSPTIIKAFYDGFLTSKDVTKSRLNEIAELFGATEARKERGWADKVAKLSIFYQDMFNSKKIIIKDVDLFKRFLEWNVLYIKNGSLPAKANITRMKIMMRNGMPIYSIKEEQV